MSFSKYSNLEAKNVLHFKEKSFLDGFYASEIKIKEKFKLKTKLTEEKFKKSQFYTSYAESF